MPQLCKAFNFDLNPEFQSITETKPDIDDTFDSALDENLDDIENQLALKQKKKFSKYRKNKHIFIQNQFSRSSVGGSKYLMSVQPNLPESSDLTFESRFESGNLAKAVKITPVYYELYLRSDLYTNRHSQWFYFQVKNTRKGVPYRLVF